jgi:hypothetical protein
MSEKTKAEISSKELTKEQLEGVSGGAFDTYMQFKDSGAPVVLTDQELSHVVGGTAAPTTLGPYGPAAVDPKATVLGTGSDANNPGFTSDQFTNGSSGRG